MKRYSDLEMAHADLPQETRNEIYLRGSVKSFDVKRVLFCAGLF
jgi:hypothetical protein